MKCAVLASSAVWLAACAASPDPTEERIVRDTPLSSRLRAQAARAPLVVAHRGDSSGWPENTLPAFEAALRAGSDMVELDFRATRDGHLVCLHDATVDRTTDGARRLGRDRIPVDSLTLEELATFDAGGWKGDAHRGTRVPTLEQALEVIQGGAVAMVEHKAGDAAALVDLLRRRGWLDAVLVQSFDWQWLAEVRALAPELTLGALGEKRLSAERLAALEQLDVQMVHWKHEDLTLEDLDALRRRGFLTCVYTVDADLALLGCRAAGLDAITTNRPARLRALSEGRSD